MKLNMLLILIATLCILPTYGFAKNVVIFPFYNKEGKDIPPASIGVLKSIMQLAKFFPSAKIAESTFDVKGRDIKEVIKATPGYENYIIGFYSKQGETFSYSISIYDSNGNTITSFQISSEDLFEVADKAMTQIFSLYSGKLTGFATINIVSELEQEKTCTILLNDEILTSIPGRTNISVKVVSRVPYNVIVRDDKTKEIILARTIVLLDNEVDKIFVKAEEKMGQEEKPKPQVQQPYVPKHQVVLDIKKGIESRAFLDNSVFQTLKEDAKLLSLNIRQNIYKEHSISIPVTLICSAINVLIPGLGCLVMGDNGGAIVALFSPYLTLLSTSLFIEDKFLALSFGITTIVGYCYNIARPFIYRNFWNTRLEDLLLLEEADYLTLDLRENVSLNLSPTKLSLNIEF